MLRFYTTIAHIILRLGGWRLTVQTGQGPGNQGQGNQGQGSQGQGSQGQGNQGGHYQPPSQPPGGTSGGGGETSTLAIVTLVLGIACWTVLPAIAAWGGVITGWIELKNIEKGESDPSNKTLTQIGFWACVVNLVVQFLSGCVALAIFAGFAGMLGLGAAQGG